MDEKKGVSPSLVAWLVGVLSCAPRRLGTPSPVRAHKWVGGLIPGLGVHGRQLIDFSPTSMFLCLPLSLEAVIKYPWERIFKKK